MTSKTISTEGEWFKLEYGQLAPCSRAEWNEQFQQMDARRVGYHESSIGDLSTVFLGLDHAFGGPRPLLFETMFFAQFGRGGGIEVAREGSFARACARHRMSIRLLERGLALFRGDEAAFQAAVQLGDARLPAWFWGGW